MVAQSLPDVSGQWRLETPVASRDIARRLLITGPSAAQLILVDRHFDEGIVQDPYTTDPARLGMAMEARWAGNVLVLLTGGNGGRGAAPATPDREERLTVTPDAALLVSVTDRFVGKPPTTRQAVYRRVPIPDTVSAGQNLLDNPGADLRGADWLARHDARVEPCDGNPCFVVRNQGSFTQTILLPRDATGKYLLMLGATSSERVGPDITGLPYLYGRFALLDQSRYVGYLQGPLPRRTINAWVKTVLGVFPVPAGAGRLLFDLNQAAARGVDQNGSAAKFDDLGCYLFPSEQDARAFAASWKGREK